MAKAPYHHGNLIEHLLAVTIDLIEERGPEAVSIREVSKRVGVSPGAPFRHFKNKKDLMTAVAEQAMSRLTDYVSASLSASSTADGPAKLRAMGDAYLRWAFDHPTHFQIISSRSQIDFQGSTLLVQQNEDLRLLMIDLVRSSIAEGSFRADLDPDTVVLTSRALVYGLARMKLDGHLPEWNVTGDPFAASVKALDMYISHLSVQADDRRSEES